MGVSAWRRDELTGTTELTTLHLPRTYQGCGKFLVSLARSGCGGPVELADIVARLRETGVEFEDVEVKRAAGGLPRSIAETMSAFANSRGGIIILGLDERAGFTTVGVSDPVALRDQLATVARTSLYSALTPIIDTVPVDGAIIVLAEIEALPPAQCPCYVTARGLYNGAFVRIGDGDQRLTPYEIDRLRENSGQPRWDEEPVPQATMEDFDRGA